MASSWAAPGIWIKPRVGLFDTAEVEMPSGVGAAKRLAAEVQPPRRPALWVHKCGEERHIVVKARMPVPVGILAGHGTAMLEQRGVELSGTQHRVTAPHRSTFE